MTRSRGFIRREGARRRRRGQRETTASAATTRGREGAAFLEDGSENDKIYVAIAS